MFHGCPYHHTTVARTLRREHTEKNEWTYLPWVLCGSGDEWSDMDKKSEKMTGWERERERQSVNRQMRVRATDVWVTTLTRCQWVTGYDSGSYLQCERRVAAGSEECSVRGYTRLSRIQISAHTTPTRHTKKGIIELNMHLVAHLYCFLECCFYLAVSGSDHVDIVAYEFECEASVHESKATL